MNNISSHTSFREKVVRPVEAFLNLFLTRNPFEVAIKGYRLWKRSGFKGLWRKINSLSHANIGYKRWIKWFDTLGENDRRAILDHVSELHHKPFISIIMPTYNSSERWLRLAIDSIRAQLYPNWELCIADDASTAPHVRIVLEEYARMDKRIRVVFREHNGHISAATNSALEVACGEFVALLDHDDELPAHALYMVVAALNDAPGLNLIYSDEDKIDENGRRFDPYFKPDWNPDLLNAQNLVSHLGVYRTEVLRSIGGFREGVEGSQDWDVALRVAEQISESTIRHIPHVLYHWRAIAGSTAIGHEEKSYVASACQRVVQEHLQRINQSATVEPAFSSFMRTRYPLPTPMPLVSVILLGDSVNSGELVRRTSYPALEVIPCPPNNDCSLAETLNETIEQARGELLCLLGAGLLPETQDWMEELVEQATRPEIGAVGPMQLGADGDIRGALTVLCNTLEENRVSWGFYQGLNCQEKGVAGRAALQQNVTILAPGCVVLRTEIFRKVNGFDTTKFPNTFFEFDLCLRLVQAGYRNLWTPYSRIVSASVPKPALGDCSKNELEEFRAQWRDFIDHDPTHNPNLVCGGEWPFPAFPPHIRKPWQEP